MRLFGGGQCGLGIGGASGRDLADDGVVGGVLHIDGRRIEGGGLLVVDPLAEGKHLGYYVANSKENDWADYSRTEEGSSKIQLESVERLAEQPEQRARYVWLLSTRTLWEARSLIQLSRDCKIYPSSPGENSFRASNFPHSSRSSLK